MSMAQAAEGDAWHAALTAAGLDPVRMPEVLRAPAWPALVAGLRYADVHGLGARHDYRRRASARPYFAGAHDTAAILHGRLDTLVRAV